VSDDPERELENEGIPDLPELTEEQRAAGESHDVLPAPGDTPLGLDEYGTSAGEEQAGEPLADRLRRESPDRPEPPDPHQSGRLYAVDDSDLDAAEAYDEEEGLSAEEDAVHDLDENDEEPGTE
jgi:hypothetical protein